MSVSRMLLCVQGLMAAVTLACAGSTAAENVQQEILEAEDGLLQDLGPGSRFEMTQEIYEPRAEPLGNVPFALPERYEVRMLVEFGSSGELTSLTVQMRDLDDSKLLQESSLANGVISVTDVESNTIQRVSARALTADVLRARIADALSMTTDRVAGDADVERVVNDDGDGTVIVVESSSGGDLVKRERFTDDYRPLGWELFDVSSGDETLVASRTTTRLEVSRIAR